MAALFPPYGLASLRSRSPETLMQTHIQLRIPKSHHCEPVLSNLINQYGLKVNILGALLGIDGCEDGWFDLELKGKVAMIRGALLELLALEAEIWMDMEAMDGL